MKPQQQILFHNILYVIGNQLRYSGNSLILMNTLQNLVGCIHVILEKAVDSFEEMTFQSYDPS